MTYWLRDVLIGATSVVALLCTGAAAGTNGIWNDATSGGSWSVTSNWKNGIVANGSDGTADFTTLFITADNTVHLDTARSVGTLKFSGGGYNWTIDNGGNSAHVLTLAVSSGSPSIQVYGQNQKATISAIIAGNQGLNEASSATLVLAAANTFTGETNVASGYLQLGNANALQNSTLNTNNAYGIEFSPNISTFNLGGLSGPQSIFLSNTGGGTVTGLTIGSDNASTTYSGVLWDNGYNVNSLTKVGTGTLTLSGANSLIGQAPINDGVLQLANANAAQSLTVGVNVDGGLAFSPSIGTFTVGGLSGSKNFSLTDTSGGAVTLQIGNNGGAFNYPTYSGILSGTGSLSVVGSTDVTLTGANTFSGQTTINAGTFLTVGNANALQNSTVAVFGTPYTGLGFAAPGVYTFGGLSGSGNIPLSLAGYAIQLQVGNNNADTTYSGVMSDSGSLVKIGTGNLTLSGQDTFTGGITVTAGKLTLSIRATASFRGPINVTGGQLQLGSNGNGAQNCTISVNADNGLTFTPNSFPIIIGGLSGSNGFALSDTSGAPIVLQVGNSISGFGSTTYSGNMSGAGSLDKIGSGTLILTGANSFTGQTVIDAGAIQLGNANAVQDSTVVEDSSSAGLKFSPSIGTFTLGGLAGYSGFFLSDTGNKAITLQVGNNNSNTTFYGFLFGSGSLTKLGTGTLALGGSGGYLGGTTVSSGTLTTTSTGSLGNGPLAVNAADGVSSVVNLGSNQSITSLSGSLAGSGSAQVNVAAGKTLTDSQTSSTMFAGAIVLAAGATAHSGGTLMMSGTGTLELQGGPSLNANSNVNVSNGRLRFNVVSGSPVIGSGVVATVTNAATLELAGTVASLSSGGNRANIVNNSSASAGVLVSGMNQQVGAIDGNGTTQVNAGSDLRAEHVIQTALTIGGAPGSDGLVTINASDGNGNPLAQSNDAAFAGTAVEESPFFDSVSSASSTFRAGDDSLSGSLADPFSESATRGISPSVVPEPATIALTAVAVLAFFGDAVCRRQHASPGRFIQHGTFALQGHDPGSKVYFKDIRVKPLDD